MDAPFPYLNQGRGSLSPELEARHPRSVVAASVASRRSSAPDFTVSQRSWPFGVWTTHLWLVLMAPDGVVPAVALAPSQVYEKDLLRASFEQVRCATGKDPHRRWMSSGCAGPVCEGFLATPWKATDESHGERFMG